MAGSTSHIGILYVDLFIPDSLSLKNKRGVIKRLKNRLRGNFNVSVSELDKHDKWQMSTLGICMIGGEKRYMYGALETVKDFIDGYHAVQVSDHMFEFF